MLLAPPGSGKTTSLWEFAFILSCRDPESTPLPVIVPLGHYDGRAPFLEFLRAELLGESKLDLAGNTYPAHAHLAARLEQFLANGRLILLFDGLEEMPRRGLADSIYRLAVFRDRHRANRFVFSCRSADLTRPLELPQLELADLDTPEIDSLLSAYLNSDAPTISAALRTNPELKALARHPFYLLLLAQLAGWGVALPARPALVLQTYWRSAWARVCAQNPEREIDVSVATSVLARLALAALDEFGAGTRVSSEWAGLYINGRISGDGDGVEATYSPPDLLWLARETGFLREGPGRSISFGHSLWQQYFAASALRALGAGHPFLKRVLRLREWDDAIALLAGIDRPAPLIRQLLSLDPVLAARCAANATTVPPGTLKQLQARLTRRLSSAYRTERLEAAEALLQAAPADAVEPVLSLADVNDPESLAALRSLLARLPAALLFPHLARLFKDKDAGRREWAVMIAGEHKLRESLPHLVRLLGDPDWRVRARVAAALPQVAGEGTLFYLVDLLREENHLVRQVAAQAMLEFSPEVLVAALSRPARERNAAGDRAPMPVETIVAGLVSLLRDNTREVRWIASEILARWPIDRSVPTLVALMEDSDSNVRWLAAQVAARRREPGALARLDSWLTDPDPAQRSLAIELFSAQPGPEAIEPILRGLGDASWHVRSASVLALGRLHDHAAVPRLLPLLRDPDPYIRRLSAEALVTLRAPEAVPGLIESLQDSDPSVRRSAADILGKLQALQAAVPLIPLLQDEDQNVRNAAALALGEIRQERAIPHLVPLLQDEDRNVREAAAQALGKLGGQATLPYLLTMGEEIPPLTFGALHALYPPAPAPEDDAPGDYPDRAHSEPSRDITAQHAARLMSRFVELLNHSDAEVRRQAAQTLMAHAREAHIPLVAPLLAAPDPNVANAAYDILRAVTLRFNLPRDYPFG